MALRSTLLMPSPSPATATTTRRISPANSVACTTRRRNFAAAVRVAGQNPRPPLQELRQQLLQLHEEADATQSKANSARLRFTRLTEAAENLKKRAAMSVSQGKENEAVNLLVQKNKLMQALKSLKERIEVLDKLSVKLNEAISVKQNMLIEHVILRPEINYQDSSDHKRVFTGHGVETPEKMGDSLPAFAESSEKESLEMKTGTAGANPTGNHQTLEFGMAEKSVSNGVDGASRLKSPSSYVDFLEYINGQLRLVELDIEEFINSKSVIGEQEQKEMTIQQQILSSILKDMLRIRERIMDFMDSTKDDNSANVSDCEYYT